jgi:hypothetical protein
MACSCGPQAYAPLCQRIDKVKVLFIGTAVETGDNNDGFIKGGLWYRFRVEEPFKGLDPGVREVVVDPASGTSCQEEFTVGKRYLISSYGNTLANQQAAAVTVGGFPQSEGPQRPAGPLVVTGVCSGSRPAEGAAEEINFIRQYRLAPAPSSIFGFVRIHADEWLWNDRYPPLAGAEIRTNGPGGNRTTSTDKNGRYEISDVAPGKWALTASSSGLSSARPSYSLDVPSHGCGVANIGMFSEGSIAGAVVEQDGTPAKGLAVEYLHADKKLADPWFRERSTTSDSEGKFHFAKVPPGDFFVGVHIDTPPKSAEKIPPTYWPGVTAIAEAQIVHLVANEQKDGIVIRLGSRVDVRNLSVKVQWPDGRPAASTNVSAHVNGKIAELAKTGSTGTLEMLLLNGVEYSFSGRAWTSYRLVNGNQIGNDWVDAEEKVLSPGSGPAEIVLVLNKPKPPR